VPGTQDKAPWPGPSTAIGVADRPLARRSLYLSRNARTWLPVTDRRIIGEVWRLESLTLALIRLSTTLMGSLGVGNTDHDGPSPVSRVRDGWIFPWVG